VNLYAAKPAQQQKTAKKRRKNGRRYAEGLAA
jgi:hypothetical protein